MYYKELFDLNIPEGAFEDVLSYPRWRHRIHLGPQLVTAGYVSEFMWHTSFMPKDLKHKTFLDVGANDGLNSFLAENLGAKHVTALDNYRGNLFEMGHQTGWTDAGITMAAKYLKSDVKIVNKDLYNVLDLNQTFDVVLLADVLAWLKDTRLALKLLAQICDDTLIIREGILKDRGHKPILRTIPDETGTVSHTPNRAYLVQTLKEMGFRKVECHYQPNSEIYDHWVLNFPILRGEGEVQFYHSPWDKTPFSSENNLVSQALMHVGNRYWARDKGWVDADAVSKTWIKRSWSGKALRALIGRRNYQFFSDYKNNYPHHSVTVIARR